jgi:hypothetical protein
MQKFKDLTLKMLNWRIVSQSGEVIQFREIQRHKGIV